MFIELITIKNETITINVNQIIIIMPDNKGTMIEDIYGNIYKFPITYDEFKQNLIKNNIVVKNV